MRLNVENSMQVSVQLLTLSRQYVILPLLTAAEKAVKIDLYLGQPGT